MSEVGDPTPGAFELETRRLALNAVADATHSRIVSEVMLLAMVSIGSFGGRSIEALIRDVAEMVERIAPALPDGAGALLVVSMTERLAAVQAAAQRQRDGMH